MEVSLSMMPWENYQTAINILKPFMIQAVLGAILGELSFKKLTNFVDN